MFPKWSRGFENSTPCRLNFDWPPRYMQRDALVRCMLASCMQKVGVLSHIANTRHERSAYKRGLSLLFWNFETRTLEKSSLQIGFISRFLTCVEPDEGPYPSISNFFLQSFKYFLLQQQYLPSLQLSRWFMPVSVWRSNKNRNYFAPHT